MEWQTYRAPSWLARALRFRPFTRNTLERDRRHRSYAAATNNNLTFSWSAEEKAADQVVMEDLVSLRARSREQVRNNDYARKYIGLIQDNVVGPNGIRMQAQVVNGAGTRNDQANERLERHWRAWGRIGNCEVTGQMSWIDLMRLVTATWKTDGESLVRKVRRGPYGLQLQMIDPALLGVDYNVDLPSGNTIKMGIEFNSWDEPVAYHISKSSRRAAYGGYQRRTDTNRIPASEMIHVFSPELTGQSRGLPAMSTALLRMNMLEGYQEAALINARLGASNVNYITSPDGGVGMPADAVAADGSLYEVAEPGAQRVLPPGYSVQSYDPNYPSGEFADFVKGILRGISSGLGVDYSALSGDLEGVNYSSIRAGVLETREAWKGMQRFLIDRFCRPVYEAWLHEALIMQALTAPNGTSSLDLRSEEMYRDVKWQARRWAWVDPLKDMQANELALRLGLTSRSSIMADLGTDPDEVWAQNDRDNAAVIVAEGVDKDTDMGGQDAQAKDSSNA